MMNMYNRLINFTELKLHKSIKKHYGAMLSKNQIKLICSLQQKKCRDSHQLFIVEGKKMVFELMQSHPHLLKQVVLTSEFSSLENTTFPVQASVVEDVVFKKMSNLIHPQGILAVFEQAQTVLQKVDFALVLDGVQDPGNMGTILRLADWFGVKQVICSKDCVDIFNSKVVQASMGSVLRVNVVYEDLIPLLKASKKAIYGAVLGGENIYKTPIKKEGFLVMGNEGNGISNEVQAILTNQLMIPQFGEGESLNVSMATAILLSEFSRID